MGSQHHQLSRHGCGANALNLNERSRGLLSQVFAPVEHCGMVARMFLATVNGSVLGFQEPRGIVQLPPLPEFIGSMLHVDPSGPAADHGPLAGYEIEHHDGGTVSLHRGRMYLCAPPDSNVVSWDREQAGAWEKFAPIQASSFGYDCPRQAIWPAGLVWGQERVVDEDPAVFVVDECLYLPWSRSDAWGLFTPDGDIVEAAMSERVLYNQKVEPAERFDYSSAARDEQRYIYCGYFNCHFGHFLIDTLSRLWRGKGDGQAKLLFHCDIAVQSWFGTPHIKLFLDALRIGPGDVAVLTEPARLSNVVIPKTSLSAQRYIHRAYHQLCRDIADRLGAGDGRAVEGQNVYLSRSRLKIGTGACLNESRLEKEFDRLGFAIVHPEELSLPDQIATMRAARSIVGLAGSAFHLTAFCGGKRIAALVMNNSVNANFKLIDAVSGNDADYFSPLHARSVVNYEGNFHMAYELDDPIGVARALVGAL
ncbi:glycosyltransferase 61 family protein [Methylorubrum extorquens]|uniref:glycosyltransferase 61 family protein n=1 Tax=Methylorubrum extorquens TaxID=408 RepID=UPI00209F138A|nr:glycosyltransferase 61 family protein [Methylorubrum extorquens]MCP1539010.1 hypothetical protein [Methylorubrum extorquens]